MELEIDLNRGVSCKTDIFYHSSKKTADFFQEGEGALHNPKRSKESVNSRFLSVFI